MELELINVTVVVVAQDHNPSILHPSFLTASGIVSGELELSGDPVSTPAFSRVVYENGITFQAEPSRIQVLDGRPPQDLTKYSVPKYAAKYIESLPHVPYRAVGINFTSICADPKPNETITRRFLREGPWNDPDQPAKDLGLRLVYDAPPGVVRFSIDAGAVRRGEDDQRHTGVLIQANYHTDVEAPDDVLGQTLRFIHMCAERWTDCRSRVARIFEVNT